MCTPWGKSPGHAAVWEACNAQARLHASAYRATTDWGGLRPRRRAPAAPLLATGASGRASWHVSTHAHSCPGAPRSRLPGAQSRGPVTGRPARETARERPKGCVSRRRRVTFAARELPLPHGGARWPPRRRLGKRRGPAPVGCPRPGPSRRVPPGAAAAACSCAGRGTDASSWGEGCFFGPFDMSIRAKRKMATASERRAEAARAALAARTRPLSGARRWLGARARARTPAADQAAPPRQQPRPRSRVGGFPGAASERPMPSLSPTFCVITLFLEQEVPLPSHDFFLFFSFY